MGGEDSEALPLLGPPSAHQSGLVNKKALTGGFVAIACSLCFSTSSFLVKHFLIDFVDFVLIRSVIQLCLCGAWIKVTKLPFFPRRSDYEDNRTFIKHLVLLPTQVGYYYCLKMTNYSKLTFYKGK